MDRWGSGFFAINDAGNVCVRRGGEAVPAADLHNLFGDTHVLTLHPEADGGWSIDEIIKGDTASGLPGDRQFDTDELRMRIWRDCGRAIRAGRLSLQDSQALRRFYEEELDSCS
jgi:arginine decarboxylase